MPFCPECGNKYDGVPKFCLECGVPLQSGIAPRDEVPVMPLAPVVPDVVEEITIWQGKPHPTKAPLGNIAYRLTNERLIVTGGFIGRKEDQLELTRVKDIRLTMGLTDRALGISQIDVVAMDASTPVVVLLGIKDGREVREMIRTAVKEARKRAGIVQREII